jgi:hypothetical protein
MISDLESESEVVMNSALEIVDIAKEREEVWHEAVAHPHVRRDSLQS